jgi:hypothetical protein
MRRAWVPYKYTDDLDTIKALLPDNYAIVSVGDVRVMISGEDVLGWTMEDYVIPRLNSGNFWPSIIE